MRWEDSCSIGIRKTGIWTTFGSTRLSPTKLEQAFLDPGRLGAPAYKVAGERRVGSVGATEAGRVLYLVSVWRQKRVRIVTAREASAAMKRRYRQRGH